MLDLERHDVSDIPASRLAIRSAESLAAVMAECFDAPEVATRAEQDPQTRSRLYVYADGAMFEVRVRLIARTSAPW